MRLFAALALDQAAAERLARFRLRTSTPQDGLRWSEPEQWHLTLRYFGEVSAQQVAELCRVLREEALPRPRLCIESYGLFQNKGILFAAVAEDAALQALVHTVQAAFEQLGCTLESRPFSPHITLARSRNRSGAATLARLRTPELPSFGNPVCWSPADLLLVESTLLPQGASYRTVESLKLAEEACGN